MSYLEAPKETEMVMAGVAEDAKAATNVGSVTYVESRGGFLGLRSLFNSSQAALYLGF